MDQIQRFTSDRQVEEEAHLLDPSNMEHLATFIASVAVSEISGEHAAATVAARIEAFRKSSDEDATLRLEQAIYKRFREYRRAGLLQTEQERQDAEGFVERFFPRQAPN